MKIVLSKQLMSEILLVTEMIEKEFPASYHLLTETPLFLSTKDKGISTADFEQYLESLRRELKGLRDAHPAV